MNLRFVSYIIIFVDYIIFPVKVSLSMQTCFKKITLNQNISTQNYIGCLIHYFMLSFVFVSVDSLQPLLLQKQFNIQRKDQIQNFKNAFVILFDIVVKMACAPVFGYLCDRYGRKNINMYGIICVSASMFAMPYSPSFWFYVVLRCIYATGAIAISVVPLLADYVNHKSRGTCAAFLVLMSSLGALASAYINFTLLNNIGGDSKIFYQYGVICSIIIILGLAYTCFCLKSGNDYYSKNANQRRTFKQLLAVAKKSMECPQITNGYTAAFLARGDSILLSLYLVLWTYSFYDPAERSTQVYEQAFSHASMLSGFAYLVIMLTCIIYGFYYQRKDYSRSKIMIAMLSLAIFGSLLINFANTSSSFMTYMSVIVLGLGMSGLLTASLYLVNEYSTAESRGFITGIQTFFGVVGILFQTIIGALLYEYVSRSGPFNYFAVTALVTLLITIHIYHNRKQELTNNLVEEGSIIEQEKPDRDSNNVPAA